MRKIIYQCDNCEKILSDDKINTPHININLNGASGWIVPGNSGWNNTKQIYGIFQFCNSKCLGDYFNKKKPKKKIIYPSFDKWAVKNVPDIKPVKRMKKLL